MFGFTGLSLQHVQALKREYSIYLLDNGRCVFVFWGGGALLSVGGATDIGSRWLPQP